MRAAGLAVSLALAAATAAAETHVVRIVTDYESLRFRFEPKVIEIAPGDTVVWINDRAEEHNVMTYPGGFPKGAAGFASPYLTAAGESFTHVFDTPGTYQYHCVPHLMMGMNGEVVVGRRSEAADFHEPSREELAAYRDELLRWFEDDENVMFVRMDEKHRH